MPITTQMREQVANLYVAMFGRAPDGEGFGFWVNELGNNGKTLTQVADAMYATSPARAYFPSWYTNQEIIASFYTNVLGRTADTDGLNFWTGKLNAAGATPGKVIAEMISVVETYTGTDADGIKSKNLFVNRADVAQTYAEANGSVAGATSILSSVTDSKATADAAITSIKNGTAPGVGGATGQTFTLTTSASAYTGTSGNDTFSGSYAGTGGDGTTLRPGVNIDGGGATDTLNLTVSGTNGGAAQTISAVTTNSVEKVLVSNFQTGGALTTVSATLMTGVNTVGLSSSNDTGDTAFSGLRNSVDAEMRNGSGDLTLTYETAVVAGTADTQKLAVSNTTAGTFAVAGIETVEVATSLVNSKLASISAGALKTLKVSGDKNLEITTALDFAANGTAAAPGAVVDASGLTGGLTIGTTAGEFLSITGGSGNDTFKLGALTKDDKIDGGAGTTDTIELSVAGVTIDATASTGELIGVKNVEVLKIRSTNDAATLDLDNTTGVTTVAAAANVKTVTVAGGGAGDGGTAAGLAFTLNGTSYTTATYSLAGNAAADIVAAAAAIANRVNTITGFTGVSDGTSVVTITATTGEAVEFAITDANSITHTVNAYKDVTFSNLAAGQAVDIYSADKVTASLKDASGTADQLSVNIATVAADKGFAKTIGEFQSGGNIETLNLAVAGMTKDIVTTMTTLTAAGTKTINVTGDSDLTIGTLTASDLTAFNASTATGRVNVTFSATKDQSISGGAGNDTFALGSTLNNKDTIDGGGGNDLVSAEITSLTATTGALSIANVERINLTNGGTATINAAGITGSTEVAIAENASIGTTTITGLSTSARLGFGFNGTANAATALGTVVVSLADETGTADSLTVNLNDTTDNDTNTVALKTTGIETVNFAYSTTATALASHTITSTDLKATTIKVSGSDADTDNRVNFGTVNAATSTVDAGTFSGELYASASANVATTFSAKGGYAHSIVGGTLADTITILGNAGTSVYTITGGSGNDVLNATLNSAATDFTSVSGVETLNLTVANSTTAGFNDATKDNGLNAATTVNVLGGNSLSKFAMTTATIDAAAAMKVVASTFGGTVELNLASDAFDSNLEIIGGASTADKVTTIIAANTGSGTNKIKAMSGIETLVVTSTNSDTDAEIDLANVTGLVTFDAQFTNNANADQIKAVNVADGVKFKVTAAETNDNLVIELTNKINTNNAVSLEITAVDAANDVLNLDIAEVESLTFDLKNNNAVSLDLAGVTATGSAKTALTFTGTKNATISASSTALGNISAADLTGSLTVSSRSNTSATSIISGSGGDTLIMANVGDSINAGGGSDTLTVNFNAVLGAIQVDLSSTVDQITTMNGTSNAAIQLGFESVNLSNYSGFGAEVTANSAGSTIIGTANNDQINGGAGSDAITGGVGKDTIDVTSGGVDTIKLAPIAVAGSVEGADVITGFTSGSGAGADVIKASDADFAWFNGSSDGVVALGTGATLDAAHTNNNNFTVATISTNVATHTVATYLAGTSTIAQLEGAIATALGAAANANFANTDKFLVAVDDGTHTMLVRVESAADSDTIAAAELSVIGILMNVSDATSLVAANFSFAA